MFSPANNRWKIVKTESTAYTIKNITIEASEVDNINSANRNRIKYPITIAPTSPEKHKAFFLKLRILNMITAPINTMINST